MSVQARLRLMALALVLCLLALPGPVAGRAIAYEVYAIRYGTLKDFAVRSLVAGAERGRTMDIAMMVWAIRKPDGGLLLVDAGFYRQKFLDQWKPVDYTRPDVAVERALGVPAAGVTDVIVTHVHWDHADGADLFPQARVWLQADEYEHHIGPDGSVLARAIDPDDAAMLAALRSAGRVQLIAGDDQEILPGVRVYTGGKHTFASQYVSVPTRVGTVVLASDNAYLFENLEQHLAIAQTLDAASNLAAQTRMLSLAARPDLAVPGHDPAVFARFPSAGSGVVRID
jgi:glyoxylase-like metal-dependent hydrolase (beta-lactamase superfamily II)